MQSGDAFCVISINRSNITDYILIVLQITVAESHPIKVKGLQDILSAYPDEIRKKITKKELVFVTTNFGKLKSLQRYVGVNGKAYQVPLPTEIKEFRQSVAEYNIPLIGKIKKKIAK
jgi:predicted phosphatase